MKLIDADKFMKLLLECKRINRECPISEEMESNKDVNNCENGQKETFELIIEHLEKQPTTYDVEKVVERIKQKSQDIALIYETDKGVDYEYADGLTVDSAIDIVKAGGIV